MDRCDARTGVFRLRRQLSRRCEVRSDRRRRGLARHSSGGGRRGEDDDRPHRGTLRPEARASCGGHGLWIGRDAPLDREREEDHSAYSIIDKSKREDGSLSRADFTFDKDRNVYVCPNGKLLHTTGRIHDGVTVLYRARTHDCGPCPLKPKCCPKSPERKIPRSIYEGARDAARALADTEAFEQSRRDRKRVEMLFAHLKRILRLG